MNTVMLVTLMRLLPGAEVETIPAWLYFVGPMITVMMGALATTVIAHYRKVQTGQLLPKLTVDLIVATKDAEILHLQEEVARWVGNYHIKDAAYTSLAEIIDENTDALRALAAIPPSPGRSTRDTEAANNARNRRERA
jgi:hypothetical protein